MLIISKKYVNTVCVERRESLTEQFDGAYSPAYLL